jgi:8-oxo-dGTP diphosphatase
MSKASRAIIIQDNKLLVMRRNKLGGEDYFTLVGGRIAENESSSEALAREVKEETGLEITKARLVFVEMHPEPYNEQYIYLCEIRPNPEIAIQDTSEEALLNRLGYDIHEPMWADFATFTRLAFRTPQLQKAIIYALQKGFPEEPVKL